MNAIPMFTKILLIITTLIIASVLVLAALLVWPLPEIPKDGISGDFLIRNVAVVDVETGNLCSNQYLVVREGEIDSIGPAQPSSEETLIVIEGTNRYMIPGLVLSEVSVHLSVVRG